MSIKLKGSSDGSVSFDAPADTSPSGSDITLVLPTTVGSAEQFLKNSGTAGTLEFSSMVETSTGVGIGTSSPGEKLTVAGKIQATTEFKSESGNDLRLNAGSANRDVFMQVNGSTLMTIQGSTGRVGIGTSSPSGLLHLAASSEPSLYFEDTGSSNTLSRVYKSGSSLTFNSRHTSAGQFVFNSENSGGTATERMRIDSSGRLLMGTTSTSFATRALFQGSSSGTGGSIFIARNQATPSDGAALGTIFFGASNHSQASRIASARDGGTWTGGSSQPSRLEFATTANGASSPTERMRIDSSGRVGIGTTSPSEKLEVGEVSGAVTSGDLLVKTDSTSAEVIVGRLSGTSDDNTTFKVRDRVDRNVLTVGTSNFIYSQAGSERMRIDSSGRLLIGTSFEGQANADNFTINDSGNCGITIRSGTNNAGAIYFSDATSGGGEYDGFITYSQPNRFMQFGTGQAERMRLDISGRLLIGTSTSPSAGSGQYAKIVSIGNVSSTTGDGRLMLGRGLAATSMSSGQDIGSVLFTDNTGATFAAISSNVDTTPGSGDYPGRLSFATTNDGGATPTERMRIDNNGRVGIGTASAAQVLQVHKAASSPSYVHITNSVSGSASSDGMLVGLSSSAEAIVWNQENTVMRFATNNTEAMRIDNAGKILLACTSSSGSSDPGVKISQANNPWLRIVGNEVTGTNFFLSGYNTHSSNNGYRFYVMFNGGIANFSSNNSNLCDEREKKNIVSLDSKWDKVKSWELKKFHYNEDADTDDLRYGVIAQQIEEHCPEVLTDWVKQKAEDAVLDGDGNVVTPAVSEITRKGVKEQQLMWMAIKALQEAQARIETLEAKVAALEAQ